MIVVVAVDLVGQPLVGCKLMVYPFPSLPHERQGLRLGCIRGEHPGGPKGVRHMHDPGDGRDASVLVQDGHRGHGVEDPVHDGAQRLGLTGSQLLSIGLAEGDVEEDAVISGGWDDGVGHRRCWPGVSYVPSHRMLSMATGKR